MKPDRKSLWAIIAVLLTSITIVRIYAWDADDEEEKRNAITEPSRVYLKNGRVVITLDEATQHRMGLTTAVLALVTARAEQMAYATVLSTQDLLTLRGNYLTAQSQLQKAQASVTVSRAEYQRLKNLYDRNQDASQKSVQAARGALDTDLATLSAAEQNLELQKLAAQQNWGAVIASWIAQGSAELNQVLSQNMLLVQVSVALANPFFAPQHITLSTTAGAPVSAQYVSSLPRTDPLTQRPSLLYATPFRSGLAPGMNLIARIPAGSLRKGVMIPYAAVVWWQGQAWVYVQVNATQFTREAVSTDTPLRDGYFVTSGFHPNVRLVMRGAQFLLSEEFRSQIRPEG
jgi:multidrug efflux system membrane fusion protein